MARRRVSAPEVMRLAGPLPAGSKRGVWSNTEDMGHLGGHVLSGNVTLFGLRPDVKPPLLAGIMPDILAGALPGRTPEGIIIRAVSTLQGQEAGGPARAGGDDEDDLRVVVLDFDIAGLGTRELMEVQLLVEAMQSSSAAATAVSTALQSRLELLGPRFGGEIQALFGTTSFVNSGRPPAVQEQAAHQEHAGCNQEIASACLDSTAARVLFGSLVALVALCAALCAVIACFFRTAARRSASGAPKGAVASSGNDSKSSADKGPEEHNVCI